MTTTFDENGIMINNSAFEKLDFSMENISFRIAKKLRKYFRKDDSVGIEEIAGINISNYPIYSPNEVWIMETTRMNIKWLCTNK